MKKKPTKYSEETKLSLLRVYHESGMSKMAFARHHGLSNSTLLNSWIKRYEQGEKDVPLPEEPEEDMKKDYKEEALALRKRVKELEKALALSRLETTSRDILIDKAEEYFNIPIRKKSGAKQ